MTGKTGDPEVYGYRESPEDIRKAKILLGSVLVLFAISMTVAYIGDRQEKKEAELRQRQLAGLSRDYPGVHFELSRTLTAVTYVAGPRDNRRSCRAGIYTSVDPNTYVIKVDHQVGACHRKLTKALRKKAMIE